MKKSDAIFYSSFFLKYKYTVYIKSNLLEYILLLRYFSFAPESGVKGLVGKRDACPL